MAENRSAAALSATKNTFNLLKEWQKSKETQDAYFHQAESLLKDNDDDIGNIKRQSAEERGKNISKAGACYCRPPDRYGQHLGAMRTCHIYAFQVHDSNPPCN